MTSPRTATESNLSERRCRFQNVTTTKAIATTPQQPPEAGMLERILVLVDGGRPPTDQRLEGGLQRNPATLGARKLDAERLRGPTETSPKGRMKAGPETG